MSSVHAATHWSLHSRSVCLCVHVTGKSENAPTHLNKHGIGVRSVRRRTLSSCIHVYLYTLHIAAYSCTAV